MKYYNKHFNFEAIDMKEELYIYNFGPLKKIEINEIKPVTFLIGESGSGKSTILKVLALCRWLYKMYNIRYYLRYSKISKSPFRFRIDTYLKNSGFEKYIKHNSKIKYITSFENGNKYEILLEKSKTSLKINFTPKSIKKEDLSFNKISFISETRSIIPFWAEKGAAFSGAHLGFYFHETFNDFNLASEYTSDMDIGFLNADLKISKKGNGKKYFITSKTKGEYEIELKDSSSGTQTSVPILLISKYFSRSFDFETAFNRSVLSFLSLSDKLTDFKPVKNLSEIHKKIFIHIEEPELSLFPDSQCKLINRLFSNSFSNSKNNINLLISTHSPYIINHLNLLIKAFDKNRNIQNANIDFDKLAVYMVEDGELEDLKIYNERLINTNPLSETINDIYLKYEEYDSIV